MQTAARYLQETRLPIIDIVHKVGYANHGHFSVAFRKYFGKTPRQFRR